MSNPVWTHRAGERKARDAARAAKLAQYDEEFWARERAAEERRQAERAAVAAAYARQEEELRAQACPCPSCSGGQKVLSVKEAAFVFAALSYFRNQGLAPAEKFLDLARRYAQNPTYVVHGDAVVPKGAYDNAVDLGAVLAAPVVVTGTDAAIVAAQAAQSIPMGRDTSGETAAETDEEVAIARVTGSKPSRRR